MKKKRILCPTCKQDMSQPPRKGWKDSDCPQCGQGLREKKAKKIFKEQS